ncbi:unnamed protein product [Effrenium voratum]|nr:unnamed protein product [Effrenium voratum]
MACLQPMMWLCQVAASMVSCVLFRPAECNWTLTVGFAELAAHAFFDTFHAERNGPLAVDIIHSAEAKLVCRGSTGFYGRCTCKRDEITPGDLGAQLMLHLAKQTTRFVQVGIVSPFAFWPVTLSCPFTAICCCPIHKTEGARAMPGQSFEEARPECLGVFHQLGNGLKTLDI